MKMKRLFWVLLTITMVLGMSLTAYADDVTEYNLWVGGTRVTSNNLSGAGWSYEATTKTLTLNGANISAIGNDDAAIRSKENLTIDVTADSTVSGPDNINTSSFGIDVDGILTIKGSGTLTAKGGKKTFSYGVWAKGNVTVEKGTRLIATGGEADNSFGVHAGGKVTVEEGGTLDATGGVASNSYGVDAGGEVTVEEGGTLDATGGKASYYSYGVWADGAVTVKGTLDATGGKAQSSLGVSAEGEVTVKGKLTATSGEANYSFGIWANKAVTVKGTLDAMGGKANIESFGVYARGEVTVEKGGTLYATGGEATDISRGVYAEGDVTVKGTLTAAGNTQAIYGNVKNFIAGIGWTNVEGTTGKALIPASTSARELTYKKVQFLAYTVTYKVVGGTWSDGTKEDKKETVADGSKPDSVPTGMKASEGYTGGAWDTDPTKSTITGAKTFTYKFTAIPTYEVTYKVIGGTWSDGSKENKKETVADGSKPSSVPAGMKASEGYTGGAWDTNPADTTITGAKTFTYIFNPYSYISGEGSTWTKSTDLPLIFQIKNTEDDSKTFPNFSGAIVDGKQLTSDKEYTASSGSVIIELKPTYLETLSVGEHTLTAEFTDGKADAKFTVAKGEPINLPQTGDSSNVFVHVLVGLLALAGIGLIMKRK